MARISNSHLIGKDKNPAIRLHRDHRSKKGRKRHEPPNIRYKQALREEGKMV